MIKLDKNYSVVINNTHGFELKFESDPKEKIVKGETKMVTTKDTWYFPKLSQVLNKYYILSLGNFDKDVLLSTLVVIEDKINTFSKVFAKNGKVLNLK